MPMEEEEYELVPLSPLRRMEKRLEKIEKAGTGQDMVKELIDVVKTNQQIVDDMVKINSDIINKIADLSNAISGMMAKMDEFMSRIEIEGGTEQTEGQSVQVAAQAGAGGDAERRLDKLEKRINSLILTTMAKNMGSVAQRPKQMQKRPA